METYEYPILCWPLGANQVIGYLVQSGDEYVTDNETKLKKLFVEFISKKLKMNDFSYEPTFKDYYLRMVEVSHLPAYHSEKKVYPVSQEIKLSVPVIHGLTVDGEYMCDLCSLNQTFYVHDESQISILTEHFTKEHLRDLSPEQIYRHFLGTTPKLLSVTVRIKPKEQERVRPRASAAHQYLQSIADLYPPTHKIQSHSISDVAWERSEYVERVIKGVLKERVHLLLVGESGVGKSMILQDALRKAHQQQKEGEKEGERKAGRTQRVNFWRTSSHRLIAGSKYLGDWQEKCEELIEALNEEGGYLWIDDLLNLIQLGGEGADHSVAAFLTPFLYDGSLHLIGEISPSELSAIRVQLPRFIEAFTLVYIPEMDHSTVRKVLTYFQSYVERQRKIELTQDALQLSYQLLKRFERRDKFPGKAIQFLGHCVSQARLDQVTQIDSELIIQRFIERTGLPEIILRDDLLLDEDQLREFFEGQIIGQPTALSCLYQIIKVFKCSLNDSTKPISTLLFAGPTGVGKTACVKALAEYFFGQGQKSYPLIHLDMSEFQHPIHVHRLIGTPDGRPGKLIQHVRDHPFTVILLDEIEKAHPAIFDVLLAVFDEGILYDIYGRCTYFYNTIIIMTSNLGVESSRAVGFGADPLSQTEKGIRDFFRPEFFNRIDLIVPFNSLSFEHIKEITLKELKEIEKREGIQRYKLHLEYSDALVEYMATEGFNPKYGARPLQRLIERQVISRLAHYLTLHHKDEKKLRGRTLFLDWIDDEVSLR